MKESKWNAGFEDEFPQSVLTEETANMDYDSSCRTLTGCE
jgi:hypothetical protein